MLKKFITSLGLLATLSFAAWDNVPILKQGSGQVAGKIGYYSQDPVSGVTFGAGIRYSPLSWLELSAIIPFGIFSVESQFSSKFDEDELYGLLNSRLGVRFQISKGFSLYLDGSLPGGDNIASSSDFSVGFGLQHSNLFSHVTWAKYIGYVASDNSAISHLSFGTELQFLLNVFTIYADLNMIMGGDSPSICSGYNSYNYHCSESSGGNGYVITLGVKLDLTDNVTLDTDVEISSGSYFERNGLGEPYEIGITLLYNF